jgi:hypothetical protein
MDNKFLFVAILILIWFIYSYNNIEHFTTDASLSIDAKTNLDPYKMSCSNMIEDINYYPPKMSSFIPLNEPDVHAYNIMGVTGQLRNIPNINWTNNTYIPVNAQESWVFNSSELPRDHYPFGTQLISPNSIK